MDLEKFRLLPDHLANTKRKRTPRRSAGGFLKGPIPTDWLAIAGNLPGKTLHVGLALWYAHGFEKQSRFRFTPKWHAWLGVRPHSLRKSLDRLQQAGLIRVERPPGSSPVVTILDAPEELKQ